MRETTERLLLPNTAADLATLEAQMKQEGWTFKSSRQITIVTFEREIPVSLTNPSTLQKATEIIRELLTGQPNRIYWDPAEKKAKEFLSQLEGASPTNSSQICCCGHPHWENASANNGECIAIACRCKKFVPATIPPAKFFNGKMWSVCYCDCHVSDTYALLHDGKPCGCVYCDECHLGILGDFEAHKQEIHPNNPPAEKVPENIVEQSEGELLEAWARQAAPIEFPFTDEIDTPAPPAEPSNVDIVDAIMDQKCRCGHEYWRHSLPGSNGACDQVGCECQEFVPASKPAKEAPEKSEAETLQECAQWIGAIDFPFEDDDTPAPPAEPRQNNAPEDTGRWVDCYCACHTNPGVRHCFPCCSQCPVCGRNIAGVLAAHIKHDHQGFTGQPNDLTPLDARGDSSQQMLDDA